ncbi:EAL domain-containing protein [Sphingomonas ginsenosidivorax]|uniref:EAL domain-containing protein n=1 Tax=Sphingomonas ginsenosidivorax TaxID=862135 RepID=A0A5C6UEC6_9SPHN|nr:EAL domain-containing protein [Sphingomonas ginsenosidivorax]TXC71039.1 EAL domain-containing protein [Sphingomonas ginsenosidivorax]
MVALLSALRSRGVPASDEFLLEQYGALRRQIPLMYALMFINVLFLGIETFRDVPWGMSFGVPILLSLAIIGRAVLWLRRRSVLATPQAIRRYLRGTIVTAGVLSIIFGAWGSLLFSEAEPIRSVSIALYVFVGAISCCFCLQALPVAGYLVLLFGVMPVTVRLFVAADWSLFSVGANFLIVALLILRTLSTNYASFRQVLESRTSMLAEQERARAAELVAQDLAYRDPLTGLANRRALIEHLDTVLERRGSRTQLYLFLLDLDRFKGVNDAYGHGAGDRLLEAVATRLGALVEPAGQAYRLGGDEFAVTLDLGGNGHGLAIAMADRLVSDLAAPFAIDRFSHHISASIGISRFPSDASSREALIQHADIAMYDAKRMGRSRYRFFERSMRDALAARAVLESEMRADVGTDAFRPYYQPIVNLASGRIVGFEMLARWTRADGTTVLPGDFIPIVEECGLIGELMLKLLSQVCVDARSWPSELTIAINVSPIQFRDRWLSEKILAVLAQQGFPARRISLEITENALISDPAAAQRSIESLKNQGISLALDDFGTGFSSIQHLRMMPFDKLKIDRSFVVNVDTDEAAYRMVSAIIRLAESLRLSVVAEGVETTSVRDTLHALGCREAQGYLMGRPMSAQDVGAIFAVDGPGRFRGYNRG